MHQTLQSDNIEKVIKTEICIIGAGAAGISIALDLDKTGHSVLLIESGAFEYNAETQDLNKGISIGQPYFPIQATRLRFFGGTTNHWTGQCSTLDEIDFEEREWVPNSGWPINKNILAPYYKKAHEICDLDEYEYDSKYWETKLDRKSIPFDSNIIKTKIWQKSAPTRFGSKYKKKIVNSKNIRLITHANLTSINLNEYGSKVDNITLSTLNGKVHKVEAKAFVLACGALQNVRHLLNSNNVINKGVGNQNDLVGRYFMEHPHVDSADMVLLANTDTKFYYDGSLNSKAFGMLASSQSIQRKLKLQNYSARIEAEESKVLSVANTTDDASRSLNKWEKLDSRSKRVNQLKNIIGEDAVDWLVEKFVVDNNLKKEDNKLDKSYHVLNTRCEQSPNPNSRVDLAATKDALGIPHIRLNWQLTESDKSSILKSNILIGKELGRLGIGRLKLNNWLLNNNEKWPSFLGGGWHHMGVTRMSNDPKKGVVDRNCKVHNISNLFISSSSVFTTSGVANPTLTIVAISLRLSDYLKENIAKL